MPRGYSAGGSALSFRWVLLFSIMQAVYIIIPLGVAILNHSGGLHHHSAGLIAYQEAGLHHHSAVFIAYHAAGTWFR